MSNLAPLSNEELLARLPLLRSKELKATAEVVVYLAEVDGRRLYLESACSSLYSFCIERLGYSEDAALKRVRVARLLRRFPEVLGDLRSGAIHLTGLFLLSKHLTAKNSEMLLADSRGKTRRELEQLLARWFPKSDVLPMIVPLGFPETGAASACLEAGESATGRGTGAAIACSKSDVLPMIVPLGFPGTGAAIAYPGIPRTGEARKTLTSPAQHHGPLAAVQPLSAQSYRVEFAASAVLHAKLEHARALLSHAVAPAAATALPAIFERALDALIALEAKRRQGVERAKPRRREEPAHTRIDPTRTPRESTQNEITQNEPASKEPKPPERKALSATGHTEEPKTPEPKDRRAPGEAVEPTNLKPHSRYVPVEVAREVWNRDGHQCTFVDELGRRCSERRFLTLEHQNPHARGGPATVENLCVLCKPHNQHAARREFGEDYVERKQREAETYAKVARALVAQGFAKNEARAALNTLRQRGAAPELEGLLRQALALLCP